MNKIFKILTLILFLLVLTGTAQAIPTDGELRFDCNDNVLDQWNSNDGSANSMTYNTPYPVFNITGNGSTKSCSFDKNNDYLTVSNLNIQAPLSVSFWYNATTTADLGTYQSLFRWADGSGHNSADFDWGLYYGGAVGNTLTSKIYDNPTGESVDRTVSYTNAEVSNNNAFHHVVLTAKDAEFKMYFDGALVSTNSDAGVVRTMVDSNLIISSRYSHDELYGGKIDEFQIYSRYLNETEVINLYNCNATNCGAAPSPPTAYFDLTLKDNETSAAINIFNATINGTSYATTNGTINTNINQSGGYEFNVEFWGVSNHFNRTYNNYNTSSDLTGYILEYPKITTYDNETLTAINNFNVSLSGYFAETITGIIYFPYDTTKTITIRSSNYDNKIKTFDFSDSTELNQSLIYTLARMKIKGYESPLNTTLILNYSIISESLNSSFTDTSSTTNGTLNIEYPRGETINITIDSSLYALKSDLFIPSYDMTYNISTYPTNSVYLSIYSGTTLINDRAVNITLIGPEYKSVSTTNGTYKFNNILAGSYQVDLEAFGFSDNTYYFSLSNRTHRELNYYMSSSCTDITFSLLDTYQAVLPDVVVTFNQQINGSWVDIGQRSTDISGDIVICLEEDPHLIQAVKTGYQTWEGTLTPLTTEYTIFLDLIGARVYELLFDDLTFIYSPQTQTLTGNLTNFTMAVYSPMGKVLYFGLNSTYNGTSYISNITTSASGGIATITLPLNQNDDDSFKVRFFVESTGGNYHEFTIDYNVFDYAISQYSLATIFADWKAQEGNFAVIFWVYVMMLAALGLLALSGANNIVLLIASILFIGLFSSPLIAAFSLTIGIVQITLLVLVAVAMGKGGLI